jgi:hypothetical protein
MIVKKNDDNITTGTSERISERKYGVEEYQELKCSRFIVGRSIGTAKRKQYFFRSLNSDELLYEYFHFLTFRNQRIKSCICTEQRRAD